MSLTLHWRDALSQSSKTRTEDIQKHFHRNLRRAFDICSQMQSNSKKTIWPRSERILRAWAYPNLEWRGRFSESSPKQPGSLKYINGISWKLNVNIRLPDDLVNWKHLPAAISRDQRRERERERNKEMTCQLGTSAGQKIAFAQSKLRILQSIARKKMVEASGIIKWAKIPKSLPTLFFLCGRRPFSSPPTLTFRPILMLKA